MHTPAPSAPHEPKKPDTPATTQPTPEEEKRRAAGESVIASILLTVMKLVVGLATNSLGVLSEALHSALDLMAAAMTYLAVRFASAPADQGHPYGHGKIENLSALVETLLLLVTCVWIGWEAVDRLFFNPVPVRPSYWAVGVMAVSIIVDFTRARALLKVAKKHRSQALEADALHFSTDILSSFVVIIGLVCLFIADALPETSALKPWLERADAIAALGVAGIVIHISWELGTRAVNVLLDASDRSVAEKMRESVEDLPCVRQLRKLRLRESGPDLFVELEIGVRNGLLVEETTLIRQEVEQAVRDVEGHASCTISLVPEEESNADRMARLRNIAASHGLSLHAVEMVELESQNRDHCHLLAEMHVEFPPETTLEEAHAKIRIFEDAVHASMFGVILVTHIEPSGDFGGRDEAVLMDSTEIKAAAEDAASHEPGVHDVHEVMLLRFGDCLRASFHCRMNGAASVEDARDAAMRLRKDLYTRLPHLDRITVQVEPYRNCPLPPAEENQTDSVEKTT